VQCLHLVRDVLAPRWVKITTTAVAAAASTATSAKRTIRSSNLEMSITFAPSGFRWRDPLQGGHQVATERAPRRRVRHVDHDDLAAGLVGLGDCLIASAGPP
jgi:hypothetical protein